MAYLIASQLVDALAYMKALEDAGNAAPIEPAWGEGVRLVLPSVIPLHPDYEGEAPVAWLVANDFGGYDLSTTAPEKGN